MGAFDHLIPGAAPKAAGAFDHLIPGNDPSSGGVQDWEPRQFTPGEKAARVVGSGAQGFNDTVADVVGAPIDAGAWLLRQAGGTKPATGEPRLDTSDPVGGSASIKRGLDWLASVPGKVGLTTPDAPVRFEPVTTAEKTAKGVGEGVASAASVMLPAAAVANAARAGTVTQGVAGALARQPVLQTGMGVVGGGVAGATDNPLLGAAASLAVPVGASVARRAVTPFPSRLSPQETRLAAAAEREGVPLTPAQQTGSPGLRAAEDTMAKIPGSSGPMKTVVDEQRQQFNRAVLERAGVTAKDASPETIDRAFVVAGRNFDDLAARTVVNPDRQFVFDVEKAARDYGRRLETNVAPIFKSYTDDLEPLLQAVQKPGANPQIAGDVYKNIRSDLTTSIRRTQDLQLKEALGGLVEALDGAMTRSTSGALNKEWKEVRRQYQALMTVDKAMQGGTQADRAAGNVPLSSLKSAVAQGDRAGYSRGRGQLNELSRVGDFIGQRTGDSGTATRSAISNPLMWPVMAAGNVAARGYNTPLMQNYLTNQALPGRTNFSGAYGGFAGQNLLRLGVEQ